MIWTDARGSTSLMAAFALLGVAGATVGAMEMSRATAAATAIQDLADATALRAVHDAGEADKPALEKKAQALVLSQMSAEAPDATDAQATVAFAEDRPAVTVRLSHKVGLFGAVTGEATAVIEPEAPVCLLMLEPALPGAWTMTGAGTVDALDCAAQVNSTSAKALEGGGASRVATLRTLVVGGGGKSVRGFTPAPKFGQPALADPYRYELPWAVPGHCDRSKVELKRGAATLQPGVYCGGLSLASHATADLAPGVYVLKDGPLKLASQARLNGNGVTFVLVGDGGYVDARAGASLAIKAPTSGPWAGFVIAQAPDARPGDSSLVIGGGDVKVDGMVYLPAHRMMITGAGEGFVGGLVVRTLDMRGNGRLKLAPGPHSPMLPGTPRLEEEGPPPPPPGGGPA